jgi:flagellar biosynthesis/type III secretory pathway chaperone
MATDDRMLAALDRLLAAERGALRDARYADLARLATQKADLVMRLCGVDATGARTARVRAALLRQEAVLRAARAGARAARRQESGSPLLTIYGPDGASGTIDAQGARIARRF